MAVVTFVFLSPTWLGAGLATLIMIVGALFSRVVWNRWTDPETKHKELEDRVRNWLP